MRRCVSIDEGKIAVQTAEFECSAAEVIEAAVVAVEDAMPDGELCRRTEGEALKVVMAHRLVGLLVPLLLDDDLAQAPAPSVCQLHRGRWPEGEG